MNMLQGMAYIKVKKKIILRTMTSALNDSFLLPDQDTNWFLV